MSGDGADELFGGYEWYRAIKYYNLLPKSVKNFLFQLIKGMPLKNKNNGYLTLSKVNLFLSIFQMTHMFKYLFGNHHIVNLKILI